jgi:polar amino acid transport system substrate-binding protein/glutamate/aspartate transport system substrate-binding protein
MRYLHPVARAALLAAATAISVAAIAAPAATAQTLERIRETGEIRLGYRTDAAPLSHADPDGLPTGYSVMVCEAVADHLAEALDLEELARSFVIVDISDRFDAVSEGRIDLLCGAASITLTRREQVDFSLPIYVDGAAVLLPADADPEFTALSGKTVGVRGGTTTEEILTNSLEAAGVEAEILAVDSHAAGLAALENGEIAAYFGDQSILFGLYFSSDAADRLVISDNTLTIEKQGLALPRGDADFRLAVDRAISDIFRSGAMAEIFRAAFPGATPGVGLEALFLLGPELP